jgi:hypothetical protein
MIAGQTTARAPYEGLRRVLFSVGTTTDRPGSADALLDRMGGRRRYDNVLSVGCSSGCGLVLRHLNVPKGVARFTPVT